jgi:hypothetical protein
MVPTVYERDTSVLRTVTHRKTDVIRRKAELHAGSGAASGGTGPPAVVAAEKDIIPINTNHTYLQLSRLRRYVKVGSIGSIFRVE